MVVSLQQGGGSKDTWVLTTGPVSTFSMLRPTCGLCRAQPRRQRSAQPRRRQLVLARPLCRARGKPGAPAARHSRASHGKVRLGGSARSCPVCSGALTHLYQSFPGFVGEGSDARLAHPEEELYAMVFNQDRAGSLAYTLHSLYRVAGSVRDRISMDMWRSPQRPGSFRSRKNTTDW